MKRHPSDNHGCFILSNREMNLFWYGFGQNSHGKDKKHQKLHYYRHRRRKTWSFRDPRKPKMKKMKGHSKNLTRWQFCWVPRYHFFVNSEVWEIKEFKLKQWFLSCGGNKHHIIINFYLSCKQWNQNLILNTVITKHRLQLRAERPPKNNYRNWKVEFWYASEVSRTCINV